jgi:hypothetical protein
VAVVAILLTWRTQGGAASEPGWLTRIVKRVEAAEPAAKIRELDAYLKRNPGSVDARLELARAHLANGDAAAAEAELARALDAGLPMVRAAVPLAEALLALNRDRERGRSPCAGGPRGCRSLGRAAGPPVVGLSGRR